MRKVQSQRIKTSLVDESDFARIRQDFQIPDFEPQPGMVYARTRAISARVNRNFDGFPSAELKRAYATFQGRPVFVNHENHDPSRTRGIIVASAYREAGSDKYIELFTEVDAKAYPKLAKEIELGNIDSVSMGCDVQSTVCSYCGNRAVDTRDFCDHVLYSKGKTLSRMASNGALEDVLVYEECEGVNFFEISWVFDPADETALTQEVIIPRHSKVAFGERTAPVEVDTLRDENVCPDCGDESFDGIECRWCDYRQPPEQLREPDLEEASEVDLRQDEESEIQDSGSSETPREELEMTKRKPSLESALSKRRLRAANQRLADDSVNRQPMEGEEQIADTPAAQTGVSTEDVMNEGTDTDVTNIDQTAVPVDLDADQTIDVEKSEGAIGNSSPKAARRRRSSANPGLRNRRAGLTDGDGEGQGQDGDGFEGSDAAAAEPDARTDVEAPVANTTDDRAQASQYDASDYDNQGNGVRNPDTSTDHNWVPGKGEQPSKKFETAASVKASSMEALLLAEAYVEHGLIASSQQRLAKFAEFEKLPAVIVSDRLALLGELKTASKTARVASRASVPRSAQGRPALNLGRAASHTTSTSDSDNTLLFVN